MVRRAFATLPEVTPAADAQAEYVGGDYRETRSLEQVHVILGFPGVGFRDPDYYTASVLATLLGGGMSSRLFQTVREERGLVYTIFAFHGAAVDSGIFGVYAGTGAQDVAELLPVVCDEIAGVARHVGEAELDRARAQLKASILMNQESTSGRCEQLANQLLIYGRPVPPQEIVASIEAVDAAAVRRLASRLAASRPTLTSLGPVEQVAAYDTLVERFAA
jgi:predicted Zn-dependent peptidase